MAEPFLGEIRIMSFVFAPKGWALCNGEELPINQNQALFSLLGTTYGGNGATNFALPNLQARVPIHKGNGHPLGERGGADSHTLSISELPAHTHVPQASPAVGTLVSPAGALAAAASNAYRPADSLTALHPASVMTVGGSQAHENRQPFLVLNFCIALQGIFPSAT